jgi:hypothetical protein
MGKVGAKREVAFLTRQGGYFLRVIVEQVLGAFNLKTEVSKLRSRLIRGGQYLYSPSMKAAEKVAGLETTQEASCSSVSLSPLEWRLWKMQSLEKFLFVTFMSVKPKQSKP